jgi:serine/threonine protein kinase
MNKVICPNCGSDNVSENENCEECKTTLKLNDKYYLKKVIGENNQITYLALTGTEALEVRVETIVIKELSVSSLEEWKNEDLFKREVAVLKSLNHEQIPKLIDDFELSDGRGDVYYLVMEYIKGISLADEISEKRYSEEESLELIEELLSILDYLHSFSPPIVHRDIKPSNIIRRKSDNKLVLIDFGAVTDVLKPEGGSTVVGTYGYMAPEQFMGKANVQSDYYSLGAIIIKLLTKQEVYEVIDIADLGFIDKINVSDKMKIILKKLLTLDLNQRAKSTKEILELIKKYKNNTLDTAANVGVSLRARPTTLPKKKKEKKEIDKKTLKKFKEKYDKLDRILSEIENKKKEEWFDTFGIVGLILFSFLMIFLTIKDIEKSFMDKVGLFFMFSGISSFLFVGFILITKPLGRLKKFLEKTSYSGFDHELLYLFIEDNQYRLKIKHKKMELLATRNDQFMNLDQGKLILYREILKGIKEK